jgi:bile acid:Na+ symporter, BASS family
MIVWLLRFLRRYGTAVIAAGLLVGLAFAPLAHLLRPGLWLFAFLLTAASFLAVDWHVLIAHARRAALMLLLPAWLLLASPVLVDVVARLGGSATPLAQSLVLWAGSAPLVSSPALAMLLGLDGALALTAMISGTFLMPFILPPLVLGLIGLDLGIDVFVLMERLSLFVGSAALLAAVLRRFAGSRRIESSGAEIGGFNVLLLFLFAAAAMDGVGELILARPAAVLLYVASAFIANIGLQAVGVLISWRLGRVPALTVGLVSGNRNMAVVIANLGSATTPEIALFFAAAQFPIYMLPAALAPIYRLLGIAVPAPPRKST